MATVRNQLNDTLPIRMVAPAGGVTSGVPVLIGASGVGFMAVPAADAAVGEEFAGWVTGVFEVPKQASLVIAAGVDVYWDVAGAEADTTATNEALGKCVRAAAASDTHVAVWLYSTYAVV